MKTEILIELANQNLTCANYSDIPKKFNENFRASVDTPNLKAYHLLILERDYVYIVALKAARYAQPSHPLIGDYIERANGACSRITVMYDDKCQDGGGTGSFHMFASGRSNYSGTCGNLIQLEALKLTPEKKDAEFWFFSNKDAKASNGVHFLCPVRVWKESGN